MLNRLRLHIRKSSSRWVTQTTALAKNMLIWILVSDTLRTLCGDACTDWSSFRMTVDIIGVRTITLNLGLELNIKFSSCPEEKRRNPMTTFMLQEISVLQKINDHSRLPWWHLSVFYLHQSLPAMERWPSLPGGCAADEQNVKNISENLSCPCGLHTCSPRCWRCLCFYLELSC